MAMTFYMTFLMTPMAMPFAIIFWQDVNILDFVVFAFLGLTSNLAHFSLCKAISIDKLTNVLPFDFTRLIFVGIFSYLLFKDQTNIFDIIGSAIIISINIYLVKSNKATKELIKTKKTQDNI
jgi:drug/metabolite transporter (DMT)-like permease